jgi:UDP-glucose 4-epimerase
MLAAAGDTVDGLGHGAWTTHERAEWGIRHWVNGEISGSNLDSLAAVGERPDAIVHLAGGSSVGSAIAQPREDFSRTVVATAELLEWIRSHAPECRLAVASSAAVYGSGHAGPIPEVASLRPYSPYGHHKLMMELLCRSYGDTYGVRSIALRLFSVYGPELRKQLLWDLCEKLRRGAAPIEMGGSGVELRDWVHVEDAVRAISECVWEAEPGVPVMNVGTGTSLSVAQVVDTVCKAWASEGGQRHLVKFSGRSRPGDPDSLVADNSKLEASGFRCRVAAEQGMAGYVRWFLADV